ncbi:hypothetical protein QUB70_07325 [Microcoleus sp. A003_D6]|uniref:hypothetical protein n=1 Tax=Microcoleus sp. A003_D6 TaxID=3055266 RepID=UPI002FD4E7FD
MPNPYSPQENSIFVEQASCLLRAGRMPNPYSPQENSIFVEQASCLLRAGRMPNPYSPQENSIFAPMPKSISPDRVILPAKKVL